MDFLITPQLKDKLLNDLLHVGSMSVQSNVFQAAQEFDTSADIVAAIYDQFEEAGLVRQTKTLSGTVIFNIKASAHDLYRRGGFTAQEEILKANLQKLSDELDVLAKQLAPDFSQKAAELATIAANILSAIGLFKS